MKNTRGTFSAGTLIVSKCFFSTGNASLLDIFFNLSANSFLADCISSITTTSESKKTLKPNSLSSFNFVTN